MGKRGHEMVGGDAGKEKDQGTVADMSHVWGLTWWCRVVEVV